MIICIKRVISLKFCYNLDFLENKSYISLKRHKLVLFLNFSLIFAQNWQFLFPAIFSKNPNFSDFSRTSNFSKSKLEKKDNFYQKCSAFDMENASKMVKNCLFSSKIKKLTIRCVHFVVQFFVLEHSLEAPSCYLFNLFFHSQIVTGLFPGLALPVSSTGYFSGSVIFLAQKRLFSPKT